MRIGMIAREQRVAREARGKLESAFTLSIVSSVVKQKPDRRLLFIDFSYRQKKSRRPDKTRASVRQEKSLYAGTWGPSASPSIRTAIRSALPRERRARRNRKFPETHWPIRNAAGSGCHAAAPPPFAGAGRFPAL